MVVEIPLNLIGPPLGVKSGNVKLNWLYLTGRNWWPAGHGATNEIYVEGGATVLFVNVEFKIALFVHVCRSYQEFSLWPASLGSTSREGLFRVGNSGLQYGILLPRQVKQYF
ncbi:MAG: hypothetical protein IPN76_34690 [Saprospiraceae bacterium]|nr:hypothetical protein [Saprospiraceae bacterium]